MRERTRLVAQKRESYDMAISLECPVVEEIDSQHRYKCTYAWTSQESYVAYRILGSQIHDFGIKVSV